MPPKTLYAERLREFVQATYKTMTAFAEACEMTPQTLNNYTNAGNLPGLEVLQKFRRAGMSLDWFVDGEGTMFADNEKGRAWFKAVYGFEKPNARLDELTKEELSKKIQDAVIDVLSKR
jgi:transcriptional regulator with XRE-family HTH domain